MSLKKAFSGELEHEGKSTRSVLQAITDDILDFKLNNKDWSLGELASHVVETYYWYVDTLAHKDFDFHTYQYDKGDNKTAAGILAKFEENFDKAANALDSVEDENIFSETWTMRMGPEEIMSMPRVQAVRSFLMNHMYHHRGQLVLYIRAAGKEVPGIYGPNQENSGQ